jgi:GT2 family glycosyltransferase
MPEISIVIASFSGLQTLEQCLDSLRPWDEHAQVVVASNLRADQLTSIVQRWPNVHFVSEPGADVFRLRTIGVQAASGEVIAMTEDHVTFSPRWLSAIRQGIQAHPIVGGPIENGLSGIWDWALFACEYITFLPDSSPPRFAAEAEPPSGAGEGGALPIGVLSGVNVAYRREVLESCPDAWGQYFRENEVHDALRENGYGLHRLPEAIVSSHLKMTLGGAMDHLFTGAKHYGRYRKGWETGPRRRMLLLTVLLVPAVLLWRILRAALSRRPHRLGTIILGLPMILCLIAAWSCGEAMGYASSPLQPKAPCLEEAHDAIR